MRAFVFPGQGSQTIGMGKDFYDNFTESKNVFEEVDDVLGRKLSNIIFGESQEELTKTENAQPALMCVSMAILKAIEKESGKNIEDLCDFVAGHSLGEYSALCASGALSLKDTAKLLEIRGKAFADVSSQTDGSMAAIISVDLETVEKIAKEAIRGDEVCQVVNDNSVGQIVISGHRTAVDRASLLAKEMGAKYVFKFPVSGAFHSELMKPAVEIIKHALNKVEIKDLKIPLVSNVTANQVFTAEEIKEALTLQVVSRVRWREILLNLESAGINTTVEIGPGKVLTGCTKRTCTGVQGISVSSVETMKEFLTTL